MNTRHYETTRNKRKVHQDTFNPLVAGPNPARPTRNEKGLRHVRGGPFACRADQIPGYLITAAPACATWPSCTDEPPEAPMAPMILPPSMMGTPPSIALMPSRVR